MCLIRSEILNPGIIKELSCSSLLLCEMFVLYTNDALLKQKMKTHFHTLIHWTGKSQKTTD